MEPNLLASIVPEDLPRVGDAERAGLGWERWRDLIDKLGDPDAAAAARNIAAQPLGRGLLDAVFGNSDFLTQCVLSDIGIFTVLLKRGPKAFLGDVIDGLVPPPEGTSDRARVMSLLRVARRRAALAIGLADLSGLWTVEDVTEALSRFADTALSRAISHLLLSGSEVGDLELSHPDTPERDCGFTVLAMGKLGAGELNYSSDIDLIVVFDPERANYRGRLSPQEFFVRLTRDLVTLLEERTRDGYVCRVDLRLRPDPGAMPLAISYNTAMTYYESMGQNWERAAMIKARPAAGDLALGRELLLELRPFVWRKNLDFWAIQDVHSIKRQIHSHKGGGAITLLGHNIKLGRGGIREIEFFAQTQQLIYGGRNPELRSPRTLDALAALAEAGRIDREAAEGLSDSYRFLRGLEHRLQMIGDQQTHEMPADRPGFERLSAFMGRQPEDLEAEVLSHLRRVEVAYAELFETAPPLSGPGSLVFTGGEPGAETVATLEAIGFKEAAVVFNLVRAWHHGRYRATRSTRAREILTELMPTLLTALGKTVNPDAALAKFDEFLSGLPAGVQLFSLLHANPQLLDLLAQIMGGAPALARHLSRNPGLLDAVLSHDFFAPTPPVKELVRELESLLGEARDFQDVLDLSRRWANDRKFQVGTQILRHTVEIEESGRALSAIAETVLGALYRPVLAEHAEAHGLLPGPGLAVIALGKLGGREMTATSDLDLIFVYQTDAAAEASDGKKPLAPSQYYARLAQRYINALTALTGEGRLYEIDMRLRPSGTAGPIAVSLKGFCKYQERDAWTWEHMALSRSRVVVGAPNLAADIQMAITRVLTEPRDPDRLLKEVAEMRARIAREHEAISLWQVKHLRGGLVDLEFLSQYLQLRHARQHPDVLDGATAEAFAKSAEAGLLGRALAGELISATRLMRQVQGFLRLTLDGDLDEDSAPEGLKAALSEAAGCAGFDELKERIVTSAQIVIEAFDEIIGGPAAKIEELTGNDREIDDS